MLVSGSQLQAARALSQMTQTEMASVCGVSLNTISSIEKRGHEPLSSNTVGVLQRIEKALNDASVYLIENDFGVGAVRKHHDQ